MCAANIYRTRENLRYGQEKGFVFRGRSWDGHLGNEKRTGRDSRNSEDQNMMMSARGLRLKESLGKVSGGIHWIG